MKRTILILIFACTLNSNLLSDRIIDKVNTWVVSSESQSSNPNDWHPNSNPLDLAYSASNLSSVIEHVQDGDRILVFPGTYTGQIDLSEKKYVVIEGVGDEVYLENSSYHTVILGVGCELINLNIRYSDILDPNASYVLPANARAVYAENKNYISIKDCSIICTEGNSSVHLKNCSKTQIAGCYVEAANNGYGLLIENSDNSYQSHMIKDCSISMNNNIRSFAVPIHVFGFAQVSIIDSDINVYGNMSGDGMIVGIANNKGTLHVSNCNIICNNVAIDESSNNSLIGVGSAYGEIHLNNSNVDICNSSIEPSYVIYQGTEGMIYESISSDNEMEYVLTNDIVTDPCHIWIVSKESDILNPDSWHPNDLSLIDLSYSSPTIQDAINQAQNGDRIIVFPGIYEEKVNMSGKQGITIEGYSKGAIITYEFEAIGDVVTLTDNCKLHNISISAKSIINNNGTFSAVKAVCIDNTKNISISDCIIESNVQGIVGSNTECVTVIDSTISGPEYGIYLLGTDNGSNGHLIKGCQVSSIDWFQCSVGSICIYNSAQELTSEAIVDNCIISMVPSKDNNVNLSLFDSENPIQPCAAFWLYSVCKINGCNVYISSLDYSDLFKTISGYYNYNRDIFAFYGPTNENNEYKVYISNSTISKDKYVYIDNYTEDGDESYTVNAWFFADIKAEVSSTSFDLSNVLHPIYCDPNDIVISN